MQVAGALHTPPPTFDASAGGSASGSASGSANVSAWGDDDDHALMELLLDNHEPMDTTAMASPHDFHPTMAMASSASPPPAMAATASVATIEAKAKSKAKLTSTEKKARHREVVRRSYHRNKATVKVLQDEVKQLEDKFRELTAGRGANPAPAAGMDDATLSRVDEMKQRVSTLDATTEQLRKESVKLQSVLLRHQEYARVVVETFESDLMEETSSEEEDDATSSTLSFGASTTSEEDGSPVKTTGVKRALYASSRPTHVVDLAQPAPIDRDARKEIGFTTLSPIDAKLISNATVSDIVNFTLSGRVVSSGGHVLGWQDRRLIDGATVRFSLRKSFPRETSYDLMAKTWQCFSDPECARQKFRGLMELRILQRVNDDTVIALRDTLNPENNKVYRFVYMLFRMRTSRGFLIGVKSIEDPKFITQQHKLRFTREGREIQWVDLSGWFLFDRQGYMEPHTGIPVETGVEVEYGGMMNYGDVSHTMMLAMNSLSLVLKWESFFVSPIFSLPPSSDL